MRRRALGILGALAFVAACGPPAGTLFRTTLTNPDGSYPLQVTLGDQTALVVSLEPGPPDGGFDTATWVRSDPADPSVLIVTWLGGACETETVVSFWPDGDGYGLMTAHRGAPGIGGGCPAIALRRAIRITMSRPIAPSAIDVIGSSG